MSTSNAASTRRRLAPTGSPSAPLYFAFGSNLSSTQMRERCPGAKGISLGRLQGWSFIINERGYANIIPARATAASSTSYVYGVLYQLASEEEKHDLDRYEGVPVAYKDLVLPVWMLDDRGMVVGEVDAICYVDELRTTPGKPRQEYVGRMNRGIKEASKEWALPDDYVRSEMRTYIPSLKK